jgi:hypothetical protein
MVSVSRMNTGFSVRLESLTYVLTYAGCFPDRRPQFIELVGHDANLLGRNLGMPRFVLKAGQQ